MGKQKKKENFIGKVSNYSKNRKHIEIPKDKRKKFKSGDHVFVEKIKR